MAAAVDEIMPDVVRLLTERAGMSPESVSASAVAHAVRKRLAASEAASPQDYLRRLLANADEFQELLEDLVVPETWFFRDALAIRWLMRRLETATAGERGAMRVLSIGCCTGEEVYSLAMALRDAGFAQAQFCVLGTDISRRALALARKGTYTARSFRETDEAAAASCRRWCEGVGGLWRVREELQAGVEFRWDNLAQHDFLAGIAAFDLIFCRNVLIYFHAQARSTAIRNVRRLLRPEGTLCTAPAEARTFSEAGFRSLGGECPFVFRYGEESLGAAAAVATVPRLPAKRRPISVAHAIARPASPSLQVRAEAEEPGTISTGSGSRDDPSGHAVLRAAVQAADSGRLEEANALCGQILSRDPASAGAHYLRGVVHKAQGALGEAQRSLEKALYLDPRHPQALIQMMLLAEQRGDLQAAANYRRRAEQIAPPEVR